MKKLICCGILLCCLLGLSLPVYALTYTDDMIDLASNTIKSYTNLNEFSMTASGYGSLPDRSVLTFGSTATLKAWANYRASQAETITVAIYTMSGSFYSITPQGNYALGVFQGDASSIIGPRTQVLYSSSANGVFATIGGNIYRAQSNGSYCEFSPATAPADLAGYAVNVYVSANGQSYSPISLTPSRLSYAFHDPLCYEELSGNIPKGIEYIRVEINDVDRFPIAGSPGEFEYKSPKRFTCLASVAVSGNNLSLGIPEVIVSEPASSMMIQSSAKESSSSSAKASSTATTVTQTGGASTKSSSSISSISKFEGVIESSASSSRKKAASSAILAAQRSTAAASSPALESVYDQQTRIETYEIPRQNSGPDDSFTFGVMVYIIIVVSALIFILINGWIKKQ